MEGLKRLVAAICLFAFPASWCRVIFCATGLKRNYSIAKKAKIGFSVIIVNELFIDEMSQIGHFNIIKCNNLHIGKNSKFLHLNFAKGSFNIEVGDNVWFNHSNKLSKLETQENDKRITELRLGSHTSVNVHILFDLSDNILIGENSVLAGSGTQIWTHSFYISKIDVERNIKITKPCYIGHNCYIGSNCGIMPGVVISDGITVGSMTCVSKDLKISGLYVSQPTRFVEFDVDKQIDEIQRCRL